MNSIMIFEEIFANYFIDDKATLYSSQILLLFIESSNFSLIKMKRDLHQEEGPWIFYKKIQINYFPLPYKMIRDRVEVGFLSYKPNIYEFLYNVTCQISETWRFSDLAPVIIGQNLFFIL